MDTDTTSKFQKLFVLFCLLCSISICFIVSFLCFYLFKNHSEQTPYEEKVASDSIIDANPLISNLPRNEDYQRVLNQISKVENEIFNFEKYINVILTHKETKEKITFADLTELEKRVLIFELAEDFTNHMNKMANLWKLEIDTPDLNNDQYENKLFEIRKGFAKKYEDFVSSTLTQFESDISAKECKQILDQTKSIHDKFRLIDR